MLRAGFSASCITPPLPCPLAGFSRREDFSQEVSQQLWARSMVIDDGQTRLGWVVCDLLEAGRPLVAGIRAATDATGCLDGQNLLVGTTHTHAGPDLYGDWTDQVQAPDGAMASYLEFLPHAVASSLVGAVSDLAPVSLAWGEEDVYGAGASRRTGATGAQRLGALVATGPSGLRGLRIVYPCHGTVLGPDNLSVSGDIIGTAVEVMETATGAAGRCSWAQGAAGDVSTRSTRRARSREELRRLAEVVGAGAQSAAARSQPLADDVRVCLERATVKLPLKEAGRPAARPETALLAERAPADRSSEALLEEAMTLRSARRGGSLQPEDEAEICVLSLGQLTLCFVPGEPFASVERSLIEAAGRPGLRVVGYSNGAPGYIFTPEEEAEGGYEVMASPLTGEAATRVVRTAVELLARARS